jgi:hypothetical protein
LELWDLNWDGKVSSDEFVESVLSNRVPPLKQVVRLRGGDVVKDSNKRMLARFLELSVDYFRKTEAMKTEVTSHPRFEWRLARERVGTTKSDFQAFLRTCGADFTPGEIAAAFLRLDVDRDGTISDVDFMSAVKPRHLAPRPAPELPPPALTEMASKTLTFALASVFSAKPAVSAAAPAVTVTPPKVEFQTPVKAPRQASTPAWLSSRVNDKLQTPQFASPARASTAMSTPYKSPDSIGVTPSPTKTKLANVFNQQVSEEKKINRAKTELFDSEDFSLVASFRFFDRD